MFCGNSTLRAACQSRQGGKRADIGPPPNTGSRRPTQPAVLWPSWPASSPWVTAVGATRFVGQKVGGEEMASDKFGSGGGFSTRFAQSPHAAWQSAVVAAYIRGAPQLPPAGSFPPLGRATPDVSALGEGFQVYQDGVAGPVGGTSASAPTFAGMVSLLNEARLQAKMPAMGFLNPFLYTNVHAFFVSSRVPTPSTAVAVVSSTASTAPRAGILLRASAPPNLASSWLRPWARPRKTRVASPCLPSLPRAQGPTSAPELFLSSRFLLLSTPFAFCLFLTARGAL